MKIFFQIQNSKFQILLFILLGIFLAFSVYATDLVGSSFIVKDPILQVASTTQMQSTSFRLIGVVGQVSIGTSSAASFKVSSGFLYYPSVTAPVATATAGDESVSLSWTAASGALGWTVSGYNIGQSTAAGGPYTYSSSLGNVTSSNRTGLSNGTTYYFVVRAEDAFGNSIATSSEVSATPAASAAAAKAAAAAAGANGPIGAIVELIKAITQLGPPPTCVSNLVGDLNCDDKVDLRDLSAFLYFSPLPAPNPADLNKDKVVDLRDLSSLFYNWTEKFIAFVPEGQVIKAAENQEKFGQGLAFTGKTAIEGNEKISSSSKPQPQQSKNFLKSAADYIAKSARSIWDKTKSFWERIIGLFR
jgi:hypothetical protein